MKKQYLSPHVYVMKVDGEMLVASKLGISSEPATQPARSRKYGFYNSLFDNAPDENSAFDEVPDEK